jgi:hypothetical protein
MCDLEYTNLLHTFLGVMWQLLLVMGWVHENENLGPLLFF